MAAWTDNELRRIGGAKELETAPVRRDGARHASIVDSITDTDHRATTLRLMPRT